MKNIHKIFYGAVLFTLPLVTFAAGTDCSAASRDFTGLTNKIGCLLNPLVPLIMTLALLYFLWGLAQFILHSSDETGREAGKQHMLYGLIGLFVMVAVWGLVNVILNTLDLDKATPVAPTFVLPK